MLLLVALLVLGCAPGRGPMASIQAGVIDFRGRAPELIKLDGLWQFYWRRFVVSQLGADSASASAELQKVPGRWNRSGRRAGRGYATYRLRIRGLPAGIWAFHIPDLSSAYRLYVDGRRLGGAGRAAMNPASERAGYRPQVLAWKHDGRAEAILALEMSNANHQEGGAWRRIRFGPYQQVLDHQSRARGLAAFLFGSLLIMALYHLGLFALRRRDRAAFFFGVFSILIALRIVVTGEYLLVQVLPDLPWALYHRLNYLTFFLGVGSFPFFLGAVFPDETHRPALLGNLVIAGLFSAVVLAVPSYYYTLTVLPFQIYTFVVCAYSLYVMGLALARRREGAGLFVLGGAVLLVAVTNDILHANFVIQTAYLFAFGLFAFVFLQAFLLSARFARAFHTAEDLSLRLEERVRERTTEAERRRQEVVELSQFARRVNSSTQLNYILEDIFAYIEREYHVDGIVLGLVEMNELRFMHVSAGTDARRADFASAHRVNVLSDDGAIPFVIRRGRPFYVRYDRNRGMGKMDMVFFRGMDLRSTFMVPLAVRQEVIGVIFFNMYAEDRKLSRAEREAIVRFCDHVAGAIYASSLLRQVREEGARAARLLRAVDKDLELARRIQQGLLPVAMPESDSFSVAARYAPMEAVGGDLYDFVPFADGRLGLFVADVSGHGVPAAMVSSMTKLALSFFGAEVESPVDFLQKLNAYMSGKTADHFLTAFYGILDPRTGDLHFANAGHPPLVLARDGHAVLHNARGIPIGIRKEIPLEEGRVRLAAGDRVLVYTDGITEAEDPEGEMFGEERLGELMALQRKGDISHRLDDIIRTVVQFQGHKEMDDDVTAVAIEMKRVG